MGKIEYNILSILHGGRVMARTDGHYCLIKVLSIKAGFVAWAAEIIAYASEYVDHATLHKGVKIYNYPKRFYELIRNEKFEPICTAHIGIEMYNLIFDAVQEKVLISFHFLPSEFYSGKGEFDYATKFNSVFARSLVDQALDKIRTAKTKDDYIYGLICLGVALHTFLDTLTHEDFSGRWNDENSIKNLRLLDKPKNNLELKILPNIGHAEAGNYPDYSFIHFSFIKDDGKKIERNNPFRFLKAAKIIFDILCSVSNFEHQEFKSFRDCLSLCFQIENFDLDKTIKHWVHEFPEVVFNFSPLNWQKAAIGDELGYDPIESGKFRGIPRYRYQEREEAKLWFFFHLAAKRQREIVLGKIKRL